MIALLHIFSEKLFLEIVSILAYMDQDFCTMIRGDADRMASRE